MDNINFTGLKNIGTLRFDKYDSEKGIYNANINLLTQLTDDKYGQDLSEFNALLKRCKSKVKVPKFVHDDNFVYITGSIYSQPNKLPTLKINGVNIPSSDDTLPLYSFVAKLTKKIKSLGEQGKIVVNKDFKEGPDAISYIDPYGLINKNLITADALDQLYSPKDACEAAELINHVVNTRMQDYFA